MSRLQARLDRLERGGSTPSSRALGREVLALVDAFLADGGDLADLADVFNLDSKGDQP